MTNVRMSLSMDPNLEARLLESAARNNEKPSPHACKMVETGLMSAALIEDRDRRLNELDDQKAELKSRLSQTSSASESALRRCAELEARAVQAEQRAAAAKLRVNEVERERDEALRSVDSARTLARGREHQTDYTSLGYRETFADDLSFGAMLQGAVVAALAMTLALVIAPFDGKFSRGVAEVAMGAWGSREKAATHLHGGPLVGGDTMLSVYVLMNTGKNPERLANCFKRADRELAFGTTNTLECAIEIPSQLVQYDIMSSPVAKPKAGKAKQTVSSRQTPAGEAARSAALAKAASALVRG